jgi:hypothetical protein
MEQTKTVDGYFGKPRQITREDFIKRWGGHFNEALHLADNTAQYEELQHMGQRIRELAGAAWDRIPPDSARKVDAVAASMTNG